MNPFLKRENILSTGILSRTPAEGGADWCEKTGASGASTHRPPGSSAHPLGLHGSQSKIYGSMYEGGTNFYVIEFRHVC